MIVSVLVSVLTHRQAPSIVSKKVYMRTSTSSHVIRYGARENMTKQENMTNGANRITMLVYVD